MEYKRAHVILDGETEKFLLIDPSELSGERSVLHRVQELAWMQRTIKNSTKCKQRGINEYAILDDAGQVLAVFTRQESGKWARTSGQEPRIQSDGKLGAENLKIVSQTRFEVSKRFKFMRKMIRMVRARTCNGMIVTGEGGLGKTYTIYDELGGMVENVDFFWFTTYATPKGLFDLLKENRHAFMVFDDMDSAFTNRDSVNILKAALDSTARRRMINWNKSGVQETFEFKGTIIFLSNVPLMKIPQPIISRSIYVDLFMTPEEKIEHMTNILEAIRPDILTLEEKQKALDFLDDKKLEIKDFNIRTLINVANFLKHQDKDDEFTWEEISEYMTVG